MLNFASSIEPGFPGSIFIGGESRGFEPSGSNISHGRFWGIPEWLTAQ